MKKILWRVITIIVMAILWVGYSHPDWIVDPQMPPFLATASAMSDKYDGDCQPTDTAGRCADKCPADTAQGTYYLQGFDKDTGAAVCGFTYFNPCPYADAQPADGPVCQKLTAEANAQQQQTTPNDTPPVDNSQAVFEGK